jgi:hypothetical protein
VSCDSVAKGEYVVIKIIPIILKLEARFISQIRQYMQVQVVVLQTKGDTKQSKVEITGEIEDEIPTRIAKILRKTKLPSKIGSWTYQKGALELWGYKEGRAGTENKHELPPPVDSTLIFGDAIMIALNEAEEATNFTTAQYTKFYTQIFQGFESLDDEDEDDDEIDEDEEEEVDAEVEAEAEAEVEVEVEEEEEEVEVKAAPKREYASARNKKIPKWAMAAELEEEEYD